MLRWVVMIAAVVTAFVAFTSRRPTTGWLFVGLAVAFNPLAPVYLDRDTWRPIDVASAVVLLGSLALRMPTRASSPLSPEPLVAPGLSPRQ